MKTQIKRREMNAKEYLIKKESIKADPSKFYMTISFKDVFSLMEEYHQHKLSEITEKKLIKVIRSWSENAILRSYTDAIYYRLAKAITNLLKGEKR